MAEQQSESTPENGPDLLRLGTCRSLLNWSFVGIKEWTSERHLDSADLILVTIFARSARTYEAIVRWLGERGFGEQGLMLNRSLFEDMIDAHWVALNRDLAVERLQQHDLYSRLLRVETQRKFPRFFDDPPPKIKVANEERKDLRLLFGKYGSGSWTGVSGLDSRVQLVKGRWRSGKDQETLLFWAAWVNKLSNEVLHPSAFSIARLGSPKMSGDDLGWHFGSTPDWLTQALHGAFWNFSQLIGLVIEEFKPTASGDLAERFDSGEAAFARADHWEKTGRMEDPPPPQSPAEDAA